MTTRLTQTVGDKRSDVLIGSGILDEAGALIASRVGNRPVTGVLIVSDRNVEGGPTAWATRLAESISRHPALGAGALHTLSIDASERNKSIATWQSILERCAAGGLDRHCLIVAIGGGMVTDTAGFAAAAYLRSVRWVAVPTTLLGMVDAALGAKTGVNLPLPGGVLGKNLVGAFAPPEAVICDVATLSTLPARVLRSGLSECLKHSLIASPQLATGLASLAGCATSMDCASQDLLVRTVALSAQVKLDIVARDPHEGSLRKHLNLGHTFAHAIEALLPDEVSHGEAVAMGLVAASAASVKGGLMEARQAAVVAQQVGDLGLPRRLPREVAVSALVSAAGYDKKVVGRRLTLVLPRSGGGVDLVEDEGGELLVAGLRAIGATDFK